MFNEHTHYSWSYNFTEAAWKNIGLGGSNFSYVNENSRPSKNSFSVSESKVQRLKNLIYSIKPHILSDDRFAEMFMVMCQAVDNMIATDAVTAFNSKLELSQVAGPSVLVRPVGVILSSKR